MDVELRNLPQEEELLSSQQRAFLDVKRCTELFAGHFDDVNRESIEFWSTKGAEWLRLLQIHAASAEAIQEARDSESNFKSIATLADDDIIRADEGRKMLQDIGWGDGYLWDRRSVDIPPENVLVETYSYKHTVPKYQQGNRLKHPTPVAKYMRALHHLFGQRTYGMRRLFRCRRGKIFLNETQVPRLMLMLKWVGVTDGTALKSLRHELQRNYYQSPLTLAEMYGVT